MTPEAARGAPPAESRAREPAVFGLIAARGRFPLDLARAARRGGRRVVAAAIRGLTDAGLEDEVERLFWIHLGELESLIEGLTGAGVRDAVMAGKVPKTALYTGDAPRPDALMRGVLESLPDLRDDSILSGIAGALAERGIRLRPQAELVPELLAGEGRLGTVPASPAQWEDVRFGWPVAKALGDLDIGQTVVVKGRAVMALEAIEGTDAAIRRGCALSGPGAVVVKVSKPAQDPRFDVPAVGPGSLAVLAEGKAGVLAVEAGRTFVLERDAVVREADRRGIALLGVPPGGPGEPPP